MKRLDVILLAQMLLRNDTHLFANSKETLDAALTEALEHRAYWTIANRHAGNWQRTVQNIIRDNTELRHSRGQNQTNDNLMKLYVDELAEYYKADIPFDVAIEASSARVAGMVFNGELKIGPNTTKLIEDYDLWLLLAVIKAPLRKYDIANPHFITEIEKQVARVLAFEDKQKQIYLEENLKDYSKATWK